VTWLRDRPSESIDLLITDPAYESLDKHRAVGTTPRLTHSKASSNDWFRIFPNARSASCSQKPTACSVATRISTCSAMQATSNTPIPELDSGDNRPGETTK
jgi:hypothetical protein